MRHIPLSNYAYKFDPFLKERRTIIAICTVAGCFLGAIFTGGSFIGLIGGGLLGMYIGFAIGIKGELQIGIEGLMRSFKKK